MDLLGVFWKNLASSWACGRVGGETVQSLLLGLLLLVPTWCLRVVSLRFAPPRGGGGIFTHCPFRVVSSGSYEHVEYSYGKFRTKKMLTYCGVSARPKEKEKVQTGMHVAEVRSVQEGIGSD